MSEAQAIAKGYDVVVEATGNTMDFLLLVKPEQDYDDRFMAWDLEQGEWIMINGWLFSFSEVE
jgi:hypothetical protein